MEDKKSTRYTDGDRINYIKGNLFKDKIPQSYKNYITPISNNISYEKSDGKSDEKDKQYS